MVAFGLVGAVGFIIDGGVLTLLSRTFGLNLFLARLWSFSAATAATWYLNRSLVFNPVNATARGKRAEYGRYVIIQVGGALLNLGVFWALIDRYPPLRAVPIVPLAVGALVGMLFNYSGARLWVFRR